MSRPKVIKAGKDPDCVHHEQIDGGLIATCCKCGQVKDYRSTMAGDLDPARKTIYGDASLEQLQKARAKGGVASRKVRRSADEESAAWASIKRPRSHVRASQLPVLTKGEDY